jgi:hypothetical protein
MVDPNLDLTCHACGQHFETKSDLQDHQKVCTAQRGAGTSKQGKEGKQGTRGQTSSTEQEGGEKTRGAGSGASWRGDSDV